MMSGWQELLLKIQFENLSDKNLISPSESKRVTQVAGLHSEREDQEAM